MIYNKSEVKLMKIVHIVCIFKDFPYLCKLKNK